ncbi:hypothetical protein ABJI51_13490 [Amycolatopsis sp. NEAU-NG30]|uniref:Uncharacterized protein n=1 Tax=Amycolatopsis melonis TaxID=3156488 RepID=A0ABV0LCS2_9PSEU
MSDPRRRSRSIGRPTVPPGPLRALKHFVYELYLRAGKPTLDTMAAWIEADESLAGAPDRTTVGRVIGEPKLPPSQADVVAVVTVLARAAADDVATAAARARELWLAAWQAVPVGKPLEEVVDPFALEVHRPITLDDTPGLPTLPRYVRRPHDDRLAEVVARALDGESAMAVLVAGSSAGKTRACWEALEPLRAAGGWRLLHPYDPTRPEAALDALDLVGPRTVVWLNEAQEYLAGEHGESVAAKVRKLLDDASRAPVLVLGTLWPRYLSELTQRPGAQVRLVLDGTAIEVPEAFAPAELAGLKESTDSRLKWAAEHAGDGQITQCLAGGPALLEQYYGASPVAKAFIHVAMDAVRMGHRNALPRELLENAMDAYLTDAQYNALEGNWREEAFAYISAPCKGALGSVTPIPERAARRGRRRKPQLGEPLYRLADYLDQYSRVQRVDRIPPVGFWAAAVSSAAPGSLASLALSAWKRGLYRDAVELNKKAAGLGNAFAGAQLVEQMHRLHPGDLRAAEWAVAHASLDSPYDLTNLMGKLSSIDAQACLQAIATRAAAGIAITKAAGLGGFLSKLYEVRRAEVPMFLARNPAATVSLERAGDVWSFLDALRAVGAHDQIATLLARGPASHVDFDGYHDRIGGLIALLHAVGADDQVATLATRAAAESSLLSAYLVRELLENLDKAGCDEAVSLLLRRSPAAQVGLDWPTGVPKLLEVLHRLGADDEVDVLAARAASGAPLEDPSDTDNLLQALTAVGRGDQVAVLLARDPASTVSVSLVSRVSLLLSQFLALGARDQVATLARRAATEMPLSDVVGFGALLDVFGAVRAHDEMRVLLSRNPASKISVKNSFGGPHLLQQLDSLGARRQVLELATRIAKEFPLEDPGGLAYVFRALDDIGAADQARVLLDRRPEVTVQVGSPAGVANLLADWHRLGANRQVEVLASRAAAETSLDNPWEVGTLLEELGRLGLASQEGTLLGRKPSALVSVAGNAYGIRSLLLRLQRLGQTGQVRELARRVAAGRPGAEQFKLMPTLLEAGAADELAAVLSRRPASHVDITDPAEVAVAVQALRDVGAEEQIAALLSRDPAGHVAVEDPYDIAELMRTLWSVGASEQTATLAARAAGEIPLRSSHGVAMILDRMSKVDEFVQVEALLARDPARHVTVGRYASADFLLEQLHELGAQEQVAVLADRIAANLSLDHPDTLTRLTAALREVGAGEHADAIEARLKATYLSDEEWDPSKIPDVPDDEPDDVIPVDQLPAAGKFEQFLELADHATRFRFGREPDGTPAEPWTWDDLA